MSARRGILVLAVVLAALLGWLFHSQFYWAREDTFVGLRGEAQDNDFLAAQRLLQRTGHPAACLRELPAQLPPPGDLLILPRRLPMAPADAARISHWVATGGLLLAAASGPGDTLFERFGGPPAPRDGSGVVSFDAGGAPLQVEMGAIARRQLGQGAALLCSDLRCLGNGRIQARDHADFLCAVAGQRPAGRVWIITLDAASSIGRGLWRRAWPALAALAALGLGALWAAAPRFGPWLGEPDPARRSFLEHLDACGRYQWRARQGRPLLAAVRADFLQRLARSHPGWAGLEPDELCRRLARASGMPPERIDRALHHPAAHASGFLEAIQTLQLLGRQP